MSWSDKRKKRLKERFGFGFPEEKDEPDKYDRDKEDRLHEETIEPIEDITVIREYVPIGAAVSYDVKGRRHRDIETGQYISRDRYVDITRDIREYNVGQTIREAKPDYTEDFIDDILRWYYNIAAIDIEAASEYVRKIVSP